ncbi:MAG: hypothetical protein IE886_00495 [Campylobacterales bacterium]|nr:hypothetical protein [Campylobacterales bacterium]
MKDLTQFQRDRNWFIIFSVAFVFGIVWSIMGDTSGKLVYTVIAFALFIHSGITMELHTHHAEHDHDGNG